MHFHKKKQIHEQHPYQQQQKIHSTMLFLFLQYNLQINQQKYLSKLIFSLQVNVRKLLTIISNNDNSVLFLNDFLLLKLYLNQNIQHWKYIVKQQHIKIKPSFLQDQLLILQQNQQPYYQNGRQNIYRKFFQLNKHPIKIQVNLIS